MTVTTFPSLGFGTAAIALGPDAEAMKAIDIALEAGIQYFDTAPLYGGGQAEVRLGRALKGMPDIILSTKCGRFREFGRQAQVTRMFGIFRNSPFGNRLSAHVKGWTAIT